MLSAQDGHRAELCSLRFHIMGGECNYLLRVNRERRLEFVPDAEWKSQLMLRWSEAEVQAALDEASAALAATAKHLRLPVHVRRLGL